MEQVLSGPVGRDDVPAVTTGRRRPVGVTPVAGPATTGEPAPISGSIERLLSPAEVAEQFGVDVRTVARWEHDGRLTAIRTLGGHRRYVQSEVVALLAARAAKDAK